MDLKVLDDSYKTSYNKLVTHPIQSWEWGEFRKSIGTKLIRYGLFEGNQLKVAFHLTFHPIPLLNQSIGYLPKGPMINQYLYLALKQIGQDNQCLFIKVEPNIKITDHHDTIDSHFKPSPKPYFTKYNFVVNLDDSEEELLKSFDSKTRYNIKVAQKHNVKIEISDSDSAFQTYLDLYFATTARQGYFGHDRNYHSQVWQTLKQAGMAKLLIASFEDEPLTAWMLINFHDSLYYPYGGSSLAHRQVMANNLVAWEAIKFGKSLKLKYFDMWGAAHSPNPDKNDPHYGFHRFKQGYSGELVEYLGTYDLIFNGPLYQIISRLDKLTKLKSILLKLFR